LGSGCPAPPHHGISATQREIERGVCVADEIDAAFAPNVAVPAVSSACGCPINDLARPSSERTAASGLDNAAQKQ
jgi:hypothetical protein